jgi:acyl-CoA reductase-like NAD-dependent aldehyde dehydrogenase
LADWRANVAAAADSVSAMAANCGHPVGEVLVSELLPLLEATRFLEKHAFEILEEKRLGRWGGPLWMGNTRAVIRREPFGVVGVISPGNYPLFLGGVQVLQALAAGNAVLWKPAPGGSPVANALVRAWEDAGIPTGCVQVLGEEDEWGQALSEAAVDKLIFTGSHQTGVRVLRSLAVRGVPSVMELSGCDAAFVREDADLDRVVRALRFGLCFNKSRTCIAPRRAYVHVSLRRAFLDRLSAAMEGVRYDFASEKEAVRLRRLFESVVQAGGCFVSGGLFPDGQRVLLPAIVETDSVTGRLFQDDFFLPLLNVIFVRDDEEALRLDAECPYALGVSIFSRDESAAERLAARVCAGSVVVNDVIAPTADPRTPFGGTGASGFGSTRGAEGLLEMSRPKVIQVRRDAAPIHLRDAATPVGLLLALVRFLYGRGLRVRLSALLEIFALLLKNFSHKQPVGSDGRADRMEFSTSSKQPL